MSTSTKKSTRADNVKAIKDKFRAGDHKSVALELVDAGCRRKLPEMHGSPKPDFLQGFAAYIRELCAKKLADDSSSMFLVLQGIQERLAALESKGKERLQAFEEDDVLQEETEMIQGWEDVSRVFEWLGKWIQGTGDAADKMLIDRGKVVRAVDRIVSDLLRSPKSEGYLEKLALLMAVYGCRVSSRLLETVLQKHNGFCERLFKAVVVTKLDLVATLKQAEHLGGDAGKDHPKAKRWQQHLEKYQDSDMAYMPQCPRTCSGTISRGPDSEKRLLPLHRDHCGLAEYYFPGGACPAEAAWGICLVEGLVCKDGRGCDNVLRELAHTPNEDVLATPLAAGIIMHSWTQVWVFHFLDVVTKGVLLLILIYLAYTLRTYGRADPWVMVAMVGTCIKEGVAEFTQMRQSVQDAINIALERLKKTPQGAPGASQHSLSKTGFTSHRDLPACGTGDDLHSSKSGLDGPQYSTKDKFRAYWWGVRYGCCNYFVDIATVVDLSQLFLRLYAVILLGNYRGTAWERGVIGWMSAGQWVQLLYLLRGFQGFGQKLMPILFAVRDTMVFSVVVIFAICSSFHFYYLTGIKSEPGPFYGSLIQILRLGFAGDFDMFDFEGHDGTFKADPESGLLVEQDPEPSQMYVVSHLIFWGVLIGVNMVLLQLYIGILGNGYDTYVPLSLQIVLREKALLFLTYRYSIWVLLAKKFLHPLIGKVPNKKIQEINDIVFLGAHEAEEAPAAGARSSTASGGGADDAPQAPAAQDRGDQDRCLWLAFRRSDIEGDSAHDEDIESWIDIVFLAPREGEADSGERRLGRLRTRSGARRPSLRGRFHSADSQASHQQFRSSGTSSGGSSSRSARHSRGWQPTATTAHVKAQAHLGRGAPLRHPEADGGPLPDVSPPDAANAPRVSVGVAAHRENRRTLTAELFEELLHYQEAVGPPAANGLGFEALYWLAWNTGYSFGYEAFKEEYKAVCGWYNTNMEMGFDLPAFTKLMDPSDGRVLPLDTDTLAELVALAQDERLGHTQSEPDGDRTLLLGAE